MPAAARNTATEHANGPRIPGSRHFDIDVVKDRTNPLPHMMPSAREFAAAAAHMGISHGRPCVIYDTAGLFSAARVWWTLKCFGHPLLVGVLDGGLPAWTAAGYPVETGPLPPATPAPEEEWAIDPTMVTDMAAVSANAAAVSNGKPGDVIGDLVIDARPAARFAGEVPEPRAGLRSGHVPGSRSMPFNLLLDANDHNRLLPEEQLREAFDAAGIPVDHGPTRIVTSCGSGVTASVLYLALAICGRPFGAASGGKTALYDGSWSEYGGSSNPIATGPA